MSVRLADHPNDDAEIFDLLRRMHEEIGQFTLSEDRMKETFYSLAVGGRIMVLEDDGGIIGTAGLHAFRPWYTEDVVIQDCWFYIHDDHRSKAVFEELLAACRDIAVREGRPLILGVWTDKSAKAKQRLFGAYLDYVCKAYQFNPCGGQFMEKSN